MTRIDNSTMGAAKPVLFPSTHDRSVGGLATSNCPHARQLEKRKPASGRTTRHSDRGLIWAGSRFLALTSLPSNNRLDPVAPFHEIGRRPAG